MKHKNNEWKVCTLEQAKKLVELGVVLETEKYWYPAQSRLLYRHEITDIADNVAMSSMIEIGNLLPAPDIAELGELLGQYTVMKYSHDSLWRLYDELGALRKWISQGDIPEAEVRCAALIWLIENGHIKPEEINEKE